MSRTDELVFGVSRFYDAAADAYAETHGEPSKHIDEFASLLPRGAAVLEVGFGSGVDANYLDKKYDFTMTGIDISPEMVRNAQRRFPGIDFRQGDMLDLSEFGESSFDGIYAEFSLIHLPKQDVPSALATFGKVLRPDGIIRLGLQEGNPMETERPAPFLPGQNIFLNVYARQEIGTLLDQHGFGVVQEFVREPKPGEHPFNKRIIHARNRKVR